MTNHSESPDALRAEIKYLEALNAKLSDEVDFLIEQVKYNQELNKLILERLTRAPRNLSQFTTTQDLDPISGYQSLTSKIREAEEKAKEEFLKSQESDDKTK